MNHPGEQPKNRFTCQIANLNNKRKQIIDLNPTKSLRLLIGIPPSPLFENPGLRASAGLHQTHLLDDYESLEPDEKAHADELYRRQTLLYWDMIFNAKDNKAHSMRCVIQRWHSSNTSWIKLAAMDR
ncbi:hypothetical protein PAAG_11943 [Paracoccidioides lutzii Pb01]|uniref:Uncharacterized protein n=1 Tax=Paracoccidioides lutzii (strain ATCC MYA-826 / Pb01) TaxID=502779 RepID=A0A0A2V5D6_PARBA|nr:hypothetical protein PAAG_11943 [Paracoccidioides lutzii Pb01]KGQ01365.1 hypothetical protein PAAG_11943 [Paracoccidioides lutzii Pb01]